MDSLLEHFMPSLMALKKALLGRQPEILESRLFQLSPLIKFKQKNIEGNLKLHKKKSESEIDDHRGSGSMP